MPGLDFLVLRQMRAHLLPERFVLRVEFGDVLLHGLALRPCMLELLLRALDLHLRVEVRK